MRGRVCRLQLLLVLASAVMSQYNNEHSLLYLLIYFVYAEGDGHKILCSQSSNILSLFCSEEESSVYLLNIETHQPNYIAA
jgi:hypothetical protein